MPKKKFIDKKKSVTFHLVHRSQQDPLVVDDTAPQHVLVPVGEKQQHKQQDADKKKEEERKFGIFFDDNYDYLQHLRPTGEVGSIEWDRISKNDAEAKLQAPQSKLNCPQPAQSSKLQLPSSVFASHVEEAVGMLNLAAPQSGLRLDLDPDVVAAMDEDFDFEDPENELEDNFMDLANASGDDISEHGSDAHSWTDASEDDSEDFDSNEDDDEVMSLNGPQLSFSGEETKSRFTEYSMTSSVIRRNNQLTLLDSRFEQMFTGYDDTEIGALDLEDIEGHMDPNSMQVMQCAEEFERNKERSALPADREAGSSVMVVESDSESDDEMVKLSVAPRVKEQWDCESVLTSRSTLYNHPKIIPDEQKKPMPIKISSKTGIPVGVLSERKGLTARALARLDSTYESGSKNDDSASVAMSVLSTLSIRPKGETPADRQARKHALKEYRKERRSERKANKLAFKDEKKKQEKLVIHNRNCANTVKIM